LKIQDSAANQDGGANQDGIQNLFLQNGATKDKKYHTLSIYKRSLTCDYLKMLNNGLSYLRQNSQDTDRTVILEFTRIRGGLAI
jgi:hypothetical protein